MEKLTLQHNTKHKFKALNLGNQLRGEGFIVQK